MDAGDRRIWTEDQDTRPLSELRRRQAARICEALESQPFDGLYSSAALRSRQTLEPLAMRFGLPIQVLPGLHETDSWLPPPRWRNPVFRDYDPLGGAYAAGGAMGALRTIRATHPSGRVAACSHGDVLPALVVYLIGDYRLELPAPNQTRGGWYTLRFSGQDVEVEHHDVLPGFPL
jgi:broad specificity phosphatase PhoE